MHLAQSFAQFCIAIIFNRQDMSAKYVIGAHDRVMHSCEAAMIRMGVFPTTQQPLAKIAPQLPWICLVECRQPRPAFRRVNILEFYAFYPFNHVSITQAAFLVSL